MQCLWRPFSMTRSFLAVTPTRPHFLSLTSVFALASSSAFTDAASAIPPTFSAVYFITDITDICSRTPFASGGMPSPFWDSLSTLDLPLATSGVRSLLRECFSPCQAPTSGAFSFRFFSRTLTLLLPATSAPSNRRPQSVIRQPSFRRGLLSVERQPPSIGS